MIFSWKGDNRFKNAQNAYFPSLKYVPSLLVLKLGVKDDESPKCTEVLEKDEEFESVVFLKNYIITRV